MTTHRHTDDAIRAHELGKALIARLADVLEDAMLDLTEEIADAEGIDLSQPLDVTVGGSADATQKYEDAMAAVEFRVRRALAQGLLNHVLRDPS